MYWYFLENVNSFILMGYCNFKYEKKKKIKGRVWNIFIDCYI